MKPKYDRSPHDIHNFELAANPLCIFDMAAYPNRSRPDLACGLMTQNNRCHSPNSSFPKLCFSLFLDLQG